MWWYHTRTHVTTMHRKSIDMLSKLRGLAKFKDRIPMAQILDAFEQFAKPKPSERMMEHLYKVLELWKEIDGKTLVKKTDALVGKMKIMYKWVKYLRRGVLCGICNWHNHRYFNTENQVITYNKKFCNTMMQKFLDPLSDKYGDLFGYMLMLDEFVYFFTDQHLMEEQIDRKVFHRYYKMIKKCKVNPKDKSCEDICRHFNVNKFSYMFDGESTVIADYISRFFDVIGSLSGDRQDWLHMFKLKHKRWTKKQFKNFKTKHSLLIKKYGKDPTIKKLKKTKMKLEFHNQPKKSYIDRKHPLSHIQVEKLDDQIGATTLYKLMDYPVDISKFMIVFNKKGGLNLFKDSKGTNLRFSTGHILALIQQKGSNANAVNERLDNGIKKMLKNLKLTNLTSFLIDIRLVLDKKKKKNKMMQDIKKHLTRKRSTLEKLFGMGASGIGINNIGIMAVFLISLLRV
jgi:hypothetical protein